MPIVIVTRVDTSILSIFWLERAILLSIVTRVDTSILHLNFTAGSEAANTFQLSICSGIDMDGSQHKRY